MEPSQFHTDESGHKILMLVVTKTNEVTGEQFHADVLINLSTGAVSQMGGEGEISTTDIGFITELCAQLGIDTLPNQED